MPTAKKKSSARSVPAQKAAAKKKAELAKKVAAKKKIELAKKVAAKKKAELAKMVAAKKKADAQRKAERVAAERARKQAQREREAAKKRLAAERKKEMIAKQKARELAAKEKAAERARVAAEKQALREAKEAARAAEREAKEKARLEALAAAARRKPEPPPKPPIIKTEFEDGIQATKEFDLRFLTSQRTLLMELRGTLTKQANRLEDEANALIEDVEMGDVQFDEEGGEGDTMVVERERDLVLSAQARHEVEEIDAALERIKQGEYGYSKHSGLPIPRERLKAIPWTQESVQERVGGIGRR